jgi:hypothetical protein
VARRRLVTFALGGLVAVAALMTATGAAVAASNAQPAAAVPLVQLTMIKVLCPSYTVVPANQNPTVNDATGGHAAQLDTSYQTVLVNPATDIPKSCVRADGWQFQLYGGFTGGVLAPTEGSPVTTGADGVGTGAVTISLSAAEQTLAGSTTPGVALWVAEIMQPSVAGFGALRCNTDILNGDNRERISGLTGATEHLYCIAYNVDPNLFLPTPTAVPTVAPATATPAPTCLNVAGAPTACPSPFQSFQGETFVPAPTATPPPTSTSDGSTGGGAAPLTVLLLSLAFGGLGLMAIAAQRRTIRR